MISRWFWLFMFLRMVWVEPEPVSAPALTKIAALPAVSSLSEVLTPFSSVVITGGSSGIGKSFIELCAKLNPQLVVCNLSRRAPHINLGELKLRHFPCDLAQSAEISGVVRELENFLTREVPNGRVLLVNNSGFGTYGPFPEPDLSNTLAMIDVNVRAVAQLTGLLLPLMKLRGGAIVNVASTAGFLPIAHMAAYAATKAFVLHWSLALNEELRGSGVHTLAFCPGTTGTAFFERAGVKPAAMAGRVSQTSEEVALTMLRAIGGKRAQAVSGFANQLMVGFCTKLSKPLAARLAAKVMARYWQRQVKG
jgi:uncharacterized protein